MITVRTVVRDWSGMSDLIRRENAIDALKKIMFTHLFECGEYIGEDTREVSIMNAEKALDVIETLPSAEPEQKKGEWLHKPNEYDDDTYECSRCGEPWTLIEGTPKENNMNYCPNCGADMRGE